MGGNEEEKRLKAEKRIIYKSLINMNLRGIFFMASAECKANILK